ncbi:ABC-type glycerol-3-phosphate transport system substrate-binding protein [Paenibacillus phyllosphaerae]|uniref:ABC-type glycerol-3-phosphate transport system substrate-binding protein n=1 Tax=Paenibacillus phyllosphaerae TaxID=274593 RepID=A0A7W5FNK8_9BACL|nr:extracellular solute-binding protein [Paenibacillus phyllosphaerae]MBB3111415.1 ABC-type glycerol-3-phosphate transport system substrate-binding protein [Paenibacillus phyllosphaerae]
MTTKKKWLLSTGIVLIAVALLVSWRSGDTNLEAAAKSVRFDDLDSAFEYEEDPYYSEVLAGWREQGIPGAAKTVSIDAASASKVSDPASIRTGSYEGKSGVLIWKTASEGWVEYEVQVPESALYEIHVAYNPIKDEGRKAPIQWDVAIDGKRPFREASAVALYRLWEDVKPIVTNSDGDEIRPRSIDVSSWSVKPLVDSGGAYSEPLQWYLPQGVHTIRLQGHESLAIERILLAPSTTVASYEDVSVKQATIPEVDGDVITLQAEAFAYKNDPAIKLFSDKNDRTQPRYAGRIKYNTVGGLRWLEQNQEITWSFDVPKSGLYKLGFRALQNTIAQKTSFRTVKIDGQVPYEELQAYGFPYDASWQGVILENADDQPYLVNLTEGKHTLSLAVTLAPVKSILIDLEKTNAHLDAIDWELRTVTGANSKKTIDRNRTWDMEVDFPGLTDRMALAADAMEALAERVAAANGNKDSISQGLGTSAKDLRSLLSKPEEIPYNVDEISSMREKFGTFIDTLMKQSLQLDEVYIIPAQGETPEMEAGYVAGLWGSVQNFAYSFDTRDSLRKLDDTKLNIWVQRGRDYVDQLQQLADESFTPETGIEVKVNLLPNPELLLMSNAAGVQPDIALGLTQDLPVNYAMRGSLVDLMKFEDFDELYPRFSPGSWLPLYYNDGYYGVPETQSFQVLYYRKDILTRLGADIPDTWEDVYDLLPLLQQNLMNFYVNPKEFTAYFYQHGVEFFEPGGVKSGLDTPEAYEAFKQWTDLFNTYAIDREVPSFYQHFRNGTMPIGISDYNMYVQLAAAAPELNGRWGIALLPGVQQSDGTISRWAGGGQRTGVIFEKSKKQEEAWQFLKWWLSTETQEQYGSDLEAMNGVAFRWNTSNVEAFQRLPWKREDAEVILEQWKWYKDIPNVPGGYFLDRELNNAWVRSVVGAANYMSSLEQAVRDINRELLRKQQEFGFIDTTGKQVKALDVPVVNRPWEGMDEIVE